MVSSYRTATASTVGRLFIQATRGKKKDKHPTDRNQVCSVPKGLFYKIFYFIKLQYNFSYGLTGKVVIFN